jgi:hypothetical protein
MKKSCSFVLAFSLVLQLTAIAQTLADVARESRAKRSQSSSPVISAVSQNGEREPEYRNKLQGLMSRSAFVDLDAAADSARTSKDPFAGGVWKLYIFYDTVATPVAGERATSAQWTQHIAKPQDWIKARPSSVTPRVALAEAYRSLAWKARGGGFADTVSDASRLQFNKEDERAHKTLIEAAELPAKCPHWYFVMLEIARDQGWNKQQTRELFEQAIALEPAYYHYYREYALNLLPKWHGSAQEAEAFADESYLRIGGRQGAFVYFEIATVLYCMCYDDPMKPTLSWPTIKEGFAELQERYGTTMVKLNRFALLAYLYQDREVARTTLARVGDQWDPAVWRKLDSFNSARGWAGLPSLQ